MVDRDGRPPELIELTKRPTKVGVLPAVEVAQEGGLAPGTVYVVKMENETPTPKLPDGKRVVLATSGGGRLELTTRGARADGMEAEATYLEKADYDALAGAEDEPTLRLYTWADTRRKLRSRDGLVLLFTTLAGLVAAGAAVWFAVWGQSPTSAATVAARSKTVVEWIVQPVAALEPGATEAAVAAARREVNARRLQATRCFDALQGNETPATMIPDVECKAKSPQWYRNKENLNWLTLGIGLITAIIGTIGLTSRFGFRKTPSG